MKFGIREVCDVHFEKFANSGEGPADFWIKSAKMTTLEGASTTVYAQGGKGNSRLIAWEGEKTLTFTVEDALISVDTFHALSGATKTTSGSLTTFTVKTTSFAATYKVTADTLFRDEDGVDHAAIIVIPKAKLQSNLNLSMAPTGDPSAFTFTFDALAENDVLFELSIKDTDDNDIPDVTTIYIDGVKFKTEATAVTLNVSSDTGAVSITGATPTVPSTTVVSEAQVLTNMTIDLARGDDITLKKGSTSHWYIV
jgi:hypothetical protein